MGEGAISIIRVAGAAGGMGAGKGSAGDCLCFADADSRRPEDTASVLTEGSATDWAFIFISIGGFHSLASRTSCTMPTAIMTVAASATGIAQNRTLRRRERGIAGVGCGGATAMCAAVRMCSSSQAGGSTSWVVR